MTELTEEVINAINHFVSRDIQEMKDQIDETRWCITEPEGIETTDEYFERGDSAKIYYETIAHLKYKWGIDYR